jgi:hypothetical protein
MEINENECSNDFEKEIKIPECHLSTKSNISIKNKTGQAYSLTGNHLPRYDGSVNSILDIIDFLDVEKSPRYLRTRNSTFCNIYAHDYADLMGVYVPRVWWTESALKTERFKAEYLKTARELNANSLYKWFDDYGHLFGWNELKSTTEAQAKANSGKCVIMVAANKNKAKSGHIVAVVPENDEHLAVGAKGVIIYPLQSQAGAINKKYSAKNWWRSMDPVRIYSN